jgi:SAM-dependent methyltransferase
MLLGEVFRMADQQIARRSTAEINNRVQAQFGPAAAAYTCSAVHSDPSALRKVVELACPKPGDLALDIATGAGHVALALAPHATKVIAYDMTEEMLLEVQRNAKARGITNVITKRGIAERLPFPDSMFDIVTVRQAPHHFADVQGAIREMARVVKTGARVVIVDSTSPENESLNRQWNQIEKLRDRSHVRNYRPSEWRAIITGAGLRISIEEIDYCTENGRPMNFAGWTRRLNTPPEAVEELRHLFRTASPGLAEALRIQVTEEEISFCVPQIWIAAVR